MPANPDSVTADQITWDEEFFANLPNLPKPGLSILHPQVATVRVALAEHE